MTASERHSSVAADASDLDILRAFEPVVHFTKGERFFPVDVERYVAQASLWIQHPDGTEEEVVKKNDLDMKSLVMPRQYPFGTIEYLRFNEDISVTESARILTEVSKERRESGEVFHPGTGRLARGGFLPRIFDACFTISMFVRGRVPLVTAAAAELEYHRMMLEDERYVYYGRVSRQSDWTVLQYWFFYCYNSWRSGYHGINDHESDWENVLVYLYEDGGRLYPEWTAYASHDFHGDDLRRRWDDTEQLQLAGGHPVVWAGAGSHASYFRKGEYQAAVALPLPKWMHSIGRSFSYVWTNILGQQGRHRDPFRIPFVDYARGDGKSIGPEQEHGWEPVVIDENTPWVSRYRGLWGLYARDPISGENAPAGPMYDRDGSARPSWYDPLGFAGLDKEPAPPAAARVLQQDHAAHEKRQREIEGLVEKKTTELHALGAELTGLEGNPHLRARHDKLEVQVTTLREQVSGLRKEYSDNAAVMFALQEKLARVLEGQKPDPRAHIRELAQPVPQQRIRFNRAAEAWGAISLSFILLAIVALVVFDRDDLWLGISVMIGAFLLVESILRGHYSATITSIAAILAIVTAVVLVIKFWLWILVVILAGLAFFLLVQKLRELHN